MEELWNHLANRQPPISFKLDDYIKQLAWKHLLKCAEKSTSIQLFKLPAPRERKQVTYSSSIGSLLQWMEYKHPFSYCPVSFALTKERGSCCSFSTRENVTAEVTGKQMDLAAVLERSVKSELCWCKCKLVCEREKDGRGQERERERAKEGYRLIQSIPTLCSYGDSLVLVASQELRERALSPPTQIPPMDISDIQYGLLEVIGCSRHYGVSRPDITTNYLKIDARSVYHHNKSLRKLGLVVVKVTRAVMQLLKSFVYPDHDVAMAMRHAVYTCVHCYIMGIYIQVVSCQFVCTITVQCTYTKKKGNVVWLVCYVNYEKSRQGKLTLKE